MTISLFSDYKVLALAGAFGLSAATLIHDGAAAYTQSVAEHLLEEIMTTGTLKDLPTPDENTDRTLSISKTMVVGCMNELEISPLDYYSIETSKGLTVTFRHRLEEVDAAKMMFCLYDREQVAKESRFIQLGL